MCQRLASTCSPRLLSTSKPTRRMFRRIQNGKAVAAPPDDAIGGWKSQTRTSALRGRPGRLHTSPLPAAKPAYSKARPASDLVSNVKCGQHLLLCQPSERRIVPPFNIIALVSGLLFRRSERVEVHEGVWACGSATIACGSEFRCRQALHARDGAEQETDIRTRILAP
jgi:hypothetical protein